MGVGEGTRYGVEGEDEYAEGHGKAPLVVDERETEAEVASVRYAVALGGVDRVGFAVVEDVMARSVRKEFSANVLVAEHAYCYRCCRVASQAMNLVVGLGLVAVLRLAELEMGSHHLHSVTVLAPPQGQVHVVVAKA